MKFLWKKWILSILKRSLQAAVAYIGAEQLAQWGLTIDIEKSAIALFAGLEALRGLLKHKWGWKFL